jgi:hypothetical protein
MTDYIGDDLPPTVMRVTKGADRKFTLRRHDVSDNPVDWDADIYINIDLDPPQRVDADVTDETAVIQIESTVLDLVTKRTQWQVIMSQAGAPTLETPLMVGTFERQDGKNA